MRCSLLLPLLVLVATLAPSANAMPLGPDCDTCQGSIYALTYDPTPVATSASTETWRITLSIDTSGYDGPGSYINTVAVKVTSDFVAASVVSAPGDLANWHAITGGLSAAGCSGSGSGFDCVAFAAAVSLAPAVPGATYRWVFEIEVPTGGLFTGPDQASVKARYVTSTGFKAGALVSENLTLSTYQGPSVPEPAAMALLATGVAVAHLERTRRKRVRS